jgi:hypothetical protein
MAAWEFAYLLFFPVEFCTAAYISQYPLKIDFYQPDVPQLLNYINGLFLRLRPFY